MSGTRQASRAFSLLELLVVVGMIATLALVAASAFSAGGKSAALSTAQVNLSNLIITARTRAVATGHSVRIALHSDVTSTERYFRYLVLQELDPVTNLWGSRSDLTLPVGVYVLPQQAKTLPGMLVSDALWKKADGTTVLHSSVFSDAVFTAQINSDHAENWDALTYNSRGISTNSGFIVLATGAVRAPGSYGAAESPVQLLNQDNVRGIQISTYGMPTLLNGRDAF